MWQLSRVMEAIFTGRSLAGQGCLCLTRSFDERRERQRVMRLSDLVGLQNLDGDLKQYRLLGDCLMFGGAVLELCTAGAVALLYSCWKLVPRTICLDRGSAHPLEASAVAQEPCLTSAVLQPSPHSLCPFVGMPKMFLPAPLQPCPRCSSR